MVSNLGSNSGIPQSGDPQPGPHQPVKCALTGLCACWNDLPDYASCAAARRECQSLSRQPRGLRAHAHIMWCSLTAADLASPSERINVMRKDRLAQIKCFLVSGDGTGTEYPLSCRPIALNTAPLICLQDHGVGGLRKLNQIGLGPGKTAHSPSASLESSSTADVWRIAPRRFRRRD